MYRVYTNEFLVRPRLDQTPAGAMEDVVQRVSQWIRDSIRRNTGDPSADIELGKPFEHPRGVRVEWFPQLGKSVGILVVEYTHPHQDDPNQFWKATVRLVGYSGLIEFRIDLASGFRQRVIRPGRLKPGRPKIVMDLIENYECLTTGIRLSSQPRTLSSPDIVSFVDRLEDSTRRLPVVLIAMDSQTEKCLVDPARLSTELVGLAEVATFQNISSSFELSNVLGRTLSCFNGGVRIYWPGFSAKDDPRRHDLLLGRELRDAIREGISPEGVIRNKIFNLACATAQDSEFYLAALKAWQGENRLARKDLSTIPELREALESAVSDSQVWEAKARELEEKLKATLQAWRESGATVPTEVQPVAEFDPAKALPNWKSADQVLKGVEGVYPRLNIWPNAIRNAEGHKSPHLDELLMCLEFLNDLGDAYFSAEGLGMPIDRYLTKKSLEYGEKLPKLTLHESETNMTGRWKEERTFPFDGGRQTMEKHFTIAPNQDGCIHLFFELNEKEQFIDIGYCGPHLEHSAGR